jgi:hypothetical protein
VRLPRAGARTPRLRVPNIRPSRVLDGFDRVRPSLPSPGYALVRCIQPPDHVQNQTADDSPKPIGVCSARSPKLSRAPCAQAGSSPPTPSCVGTTTHRSSLDPTAPTTRTYCYSSIATPTCDRGGDNKPDVGIRIHGELAGLDHRVQSPAKDAGSVRRCCGRLPEHPSVTEETEADGCHPGREDPDEQSAR